MDKHLHIISFDVPYPVNYGGACDVFHKLPAFQTQGIKIHFHCFNYGRGEQPILNQYCESVHYYERTMGHKGFSTSLPYIVSSRINEKLLLKLLEDDYPIFMEGVHCTYLLNDERFKNRKVFVRLHNVEYKYYQEMYKNSSSPLKKAYYWNESRLLKSYEQKISQIATFWGVKEADNDVYRNEFGCKNIEELPLYLPDWKVNCLDGMGSYCFYHADLSVDVNEKAAIWLLEKVFHNMEIPFVIAGKNPSKKLENLAHAHNYTCLVANPSEKEMQDMIAKAHIHLLPSFIHTGMKVKLLNTLYNGRHCVVNEATIADSGLEPACHVGSSANAFQEIIAQLYHQPFTAEEILLRKNLLEHRFSNEQNAIKQVGWIWGN
ncbi:MAG: glycosyltransferase [Sediminibacterium sp.]|nr:glycosyltransferase [Sediminibacterium sp.]